MQNTVTLSLIVPVYNENQSVDLFLSSVLPILEQVNESYEIIFINDGSQDDTLVKLIHLKEIHPYIRILDLSRNFGKEAALTAGLFEAKGQAAIMIDVDLQHDPHAIPLFVKKWKDGFDVVTAMRAKANDSLLKRFSSFWFNKILNWISDIKFSPLAGDFKLMDKKVIETFKLLPETQRYMRGISEWLGYPTAYIYTECNKRVAGKTKFNIVKLINLAINAITSFSIFPLRFLACLGFLISFTSFLFLIWTISKTLIYGSNVPGYTTLTAIITLLGGIQILALGIVAEYIGKIYQETKRRPIYIIRKEY